MSVAIKPGVPALPPETGLLSGDPVRFGSSDIFSLSPFGTATPGTFCSFLLTRRSVSNSAAWHLTSPSDFRRW